MNEIKILETYGPDGPSLSDEARQAARSRLLAEITAVTAYADRPALPVTRRVASGLLRLPPLVRMALAGAAVTAMAVLAVTVLPQPPEATQGPPVAGGEEPPPVLPSTGPVKLVAATTLEFPYALPLLGEPSFTADPGGPIMAIYASEDMNSDVVVVAHTSGAAPGDLQRLGQRITVDGRPGHILPLGDAHQLAWERRPGEWVTIVGHGRHGSEEAVLRLARQVVDQPQHVPFQIAVGLIPAGWELGGFKEGGSIVTYRDPARPNTSLSVQWKPAPEWHPDSDVEGFEAGQDVTVDGRHARLVQARERWMLTTTLPDESGFTLQAPRSFTPDQVIAVAESVRRGDS
ncbi:hypothetical protein [Melissospora conviva]|uniref:hypothetical protein n=1 Tax=Melissospora conviva TaxID=3388432 RepID=UPI003C299E47